MKYLGLLILLGFFTNAALAGHHDREKAAKRVVSGKILDAAGETLAGSVITIKETGEQFFADLDGTFTITVPANSVVSVQISSIGFERIVVKSSALFNFAEYRLSSLD